MSQRAEPAPRSGNDGMPSELRRSLAILLVLVFACGLLSGLLARRVFADSTVRALDGTDREFYVRFARTLELDAAQRAKLRAILQDKARRKREWWNDLIQRAADQQTLLTIDRRADRRIRALLDDRQRRKYESMLQHD